MADDAELRRRLELLRQYLNSGRIKVALHLQDAFEESLSAVKYGPDGEIDLATVDGSLRAIALGIAGMDYREEAKKANSLLEIQKLYFQSIRNNFGDLYERMTDAGASPHQFSSALAQHPENVDHLYPVISDFVEALVKFWESASEVVSYHLEDMNVTKGVFGGDLFPVGNIASTCGLYLDTIVLTDPFMNSKDLFPRWEKKEAVRYLLKNAMNVLSYEELALADLPVPIVVILPFRSSISEEQGDFIANWASQDALTHAGRIFGREFGSVEELLEFGTQLDTSEKVARAVVNPERVLFDVEWTGSLESQVQRAFNEFGRLSGARNPGLQVAGQCISRMMQATDILAKSRSLGGTPLIEAETSWRYFNWKLEYDAPVGQENLPLHIVQALQWAGKKEMKWLGKIPPAALIEMRQQGAAEEIRSILTSGIEEAEDIDTTDFLPVGHKIIQNINTAFTKHQEAIAALTRKKLRFWGYDIGTWVVTGAIEVGAALSGTPLFGLASFAAGQVTDAPKLKDIPKRFKELEAERSKTRKSPLGLFIKHRK